MKPIIRKIVGGILITPVVILILATMYINPWPIVIALIVTACLYVGLRMLDK